MKMVRGFVVTVTLSAAAFILGHPGPLPAQPPTPQPAPAKVELLFVQNALTGSFDGKTLTLRGVGPTLFFSDRPERVTGNLGTAEFVGHWDKGPDSFAKNPPNATLSIFDEKDVTSVVVELTRPTLQRDTLSYQAKVLTGKLPASFKESSLFIDILGRWRMAARGMAVGEARGVEMGAAASRSNPAPAQPAGPPPAAPAPSAAPAPAPAVAVAAPSSVTDKQAAAVAKLKELKSLLNQGLITQAQYQADSQKLLNQIVE
jgi:hypothetical protein